MSDKHKCEPGYDREGDADGPIFAGGRNGSAVELCIEHDQGEFWVDNGEYSTRVNYCPFCGAKAPAQVGWKPS